MTIWLLALIVLASLAGLGYRQGAIRVAFSFFGILLGAVLAVPLGRLLGKLLVLAGITDPVLLWVLGPVIVFLVVSIGFKVGAAAVHHKVDVYYKYHAGDLRLALWERLNQRLGLCLGLLNGTAYLVLLAFVIYLPSYFTVQVATSDEDPKWMRLLNQMGRDLQSTGFAKVARAIDSVPQIDYDMGDFAAMLYRNPLCEARLGRYPGFLVLADMPQFQDLANDKEFMELWAKQAPVMALFDHPRIAAFRSNPEMLKTIWNTAAPDLVDVRTYLASGRTKYDAEKILGRWNFDINGAMNAMRRAKPNMPSGEMLKWKKWMLASFNQTSLVARTDKQVFLKQLPQLKLPAAGATATGPQNLQGKWQSLDGGKYLLSLSGTDMPAAVEGDRLSMKAEGMDLVFGRED